MVDVAKSATMLKNAGAEIDKERQRLRQLLANVPGVVWEAMGKPGTKNQKISFVSDYAETLLGYGIDEWLSTPSFWLKIVHPEDRDRVAEEALEIYESGQRGNSEFRWLKINGAAIWVESRLSVVLDEDNNPIGIQGIVVDISERKQNEERQRFLSAVSETLASSLDYEETLRRVARSAVPHIADWCAVDILADGQCHRVAMAHVDPAKVALAQTLYERYPPELDAEYGIGQVLRTGRPEIIPEISDAMISQVAQDAEHYQLLRDLGLKSSMVIPLRIRSHTLGLLTLAAAESGRVFDNDDIQMARELAHRAALAVDNARLYQQAKQGGIQEERQRIARELHDVISQTLFSANMIAQMLPRLWERDPQLVYNQLPQLHKLIQGAVAEMRTLMLELRPDDLQEASFSELLEHLTKAASGRTEMSLQVHLDQTPPLIPEAQLNLYRIAQQALDNALIHSRASQIEVTLSNTSGVLKLDIADNGHGFDPEKVSPARMGLAIMRERANGIGATLQIFSRPGDGTRVTVTWHIQGGEKDE